MFSPTITDIITFAALTVLIAIVPEITDARIQAASEIKTPAQIMAQNCRSDFLELCPGVQLRSGRALACLHAQAAHLSPQCQDVIAKAPVAGTKQ